MGGNVVAAPFSLNGNLLADAGHAPQDAERAGIGQFRVISPRLSPGTVYRLTLEQQIMVTMTQVPEPNSLLLLIWSGVMVRPIFRWKCR